MKLFLFSLLVIQLITIQPSHSQTITYESTYPSINAQNSIGELSDFALDKAGNIYILDSVNNKIWVFDKNNILINQYPKNDINTYFANPVAIKISERGNIFVLNNDRNDITVLTPKLEKRRIIGKSDGLEGSFNNPIDLAINYDEDIYVIDRENAKLIRFNSEGLYLGSISVNEPVAVSVDRSSNVHVLNRTKKNEFRLSSYDRNLNFLSEIDLSAINDASGFYVNDFGEYFVTDADKCITYYYNSSANLITKDIGEKSSAKGPGKFSNPNNLIVVNKNKETDELYISDKRFNYIHKFSVEIIADRQKLKKREPKLTIELKEILSGIEFENYFSSRGYDIYLRSRGDLIVRKNSKTLFSIKHNSIADKSEVFINKGHIDIIDPLSKTGNRFDIHSGEEIKQFRITGISSPFLTTQTNDSSYIFTEYESGKTILYGRDFEAVENLTATGMNVISDVKIIFASESDLFLMKTDDLYLYKYNLDEKQFSQLRLPFLDQDKKRLFISTNNGLIFSANIETGVISIFENCIEIGRFLYTGKYDNDIKNISKLIYNETENELIVVDFRNNEIKKFAVLIESNQKLFVNINSLGFSELNWETRSDKVEVLRREVGSESFEIIETTLENSYVIYNSSPLIYEYAIGTSEDGEIRVLSNFVKDLFSYCRSIKVENPLVAVSYFEQIFSLNPVVVNNEMTGIYRTLIDKYKAEKKYKRALAALIEIQKLNPENYVFYIEKSELFEKLLDYQGGVEELETAIDKFGDKKEIYYHLISLLHKDKNYEKVISLCNEALNKFPGDEQIIYNIAFTHEKMDNPNDAIKIYLGLIQQTQKEKYYLAIGRIYTELGQYTEAFKIYNELSSKGEVSPNLYSAMAISKLNDNKLDDSRRILSEALEKHPNDAELHYLSGKLAVKQNNNQKAINDFKTASELESDNANYLIALAESYLKKGNKSDAIFFLESAVLIEPENPNSLFELGKLYLSENKIDYAYGNLYKAYILDPNNEVINLAFTDVSNKREAANAARQPIEINYIELREVSQSLLDYYSNNPLGVLTIYNTRNYAIEDLVIEVTCSDLSPRSKIMSIKRISPNEYKEIEFTLEIDTQYYKEVRQIKNIVDINFDIKEINGKVITSKKKNILIK